MAANFSFLTDPIWSIDALAAERLAAGLNSLPAEAWRPPAGIQPRATTAMRGDVAIVEIAGTLTRNASVFQLLAGGSSTADIQEAIVAAANDTKIKSILLLVDSPGGSASGVAECADAVFAARAKKPVVAFVQGMAASAAYHIASQATHVVAERMSLVGSIGAKMFFLDLSQALKKEGVRPVVIQSGPYKSAADPGTEITPDHEGYLSGLVEAFADDFRRAVVRGRGMSRGEVEAVSTGKVYVAGDALRLGLVDEIATYQKTLSRLQTTPETFPTTTTKRSCEMTTTTPATLTELEAACPDMTEVFYLSQLRAGATIADAQKAAIADMQNQLAAGQQTKKSPGVRPLATGATIEANAGDPVAEFDRLVAEATERGSTRRAAMIAVARRNPELHAAVLTAANDGNPQAMTEIGRRFC